LILPNDARIGVMGRVDTSQTGTLRFGYPGVTLRIRFQGTSLSMRVTCTTPNSHLAVRVDNREPRIVRLRSGESEVTLAAGLSDAPHTVELSHRTETWLGVVTVRGFVLQAGSRLLPAEAWPERRLLLIGDSVTCGEDIDRSIDCKKDATTWNAPLSYGMLLARALGAECHLVCYGGRGLIRDWQGNTAVLNAPQFFELTVASGVPQIRWDHAAYQPDLVIVSLGTNDFNLELGPLPDRNRYVSAYVAFVSRIRTVHPKAFVLLTEGAMVTDLRDPTRPQKSVLRSYLAETVQRLADARVAVLASEYYPGDACDAHPTRAQHAAMARDLEPIVRRTMGW
jgi:lysophospholipase L1-like esterase